MRREISSRSPGGLIARARARNFPLGTIIASTDPVSTAVFGRAGFDFVVLDREHGPMSLGDVGNHVRAAEACCIVPLVRVRESTPTHIGAALDAGAHGVVAPHVDDAVAARALVAAMRYAPDGTRGKCPGCYGADYTQDDWQAHWPRVNAALLAIPIIESVKAVGNIEEIVAVEGIDIVFFGPGDLGQELGTTDNDILVTHWNRVRDAAHAAGKLALGSHGRGFAGADLVLAAMDVLLLKRAADAIVLAHFRENGEQS